MGNIFSFVDGRVTAQLKMCTYGYIMDLGTIANSAQLGAAIRAARIRAGLTQQELANRSGASRRWWSMVEKGENPGVELGKILAALQVLGLVIRLSTTEDAAGTTEGELLDLLDQEGL